MQSNKNYANIPCLTVGVGKTFTAGLVQEEGMNGKLVRLKAIGDVKFRLDTQPSSEIIMTDGETDHLFVPEVDNIFIIEGSLNIMW